MSNHLTRSALRDILLMNMGGMKAMFEKRVMIFRRRDRESWLRIKTALKAAGLRGVRAGHFLEETLVACGCGSKLDPRDFGPKGKIDRETYWVRVPERDENEARNILRREGIVSAPEGVLLAAAKASD